MTETETSAAARLGQVISGRYRVLELLGEGGMGAVYLAEHMLMRKRVALKLLHPEMSDDEEVLARFRREAEAAAHIEHPNVARATDFGKTEDGAFFLVLEYVEGTSLRQALANGALTAKRALHIARQIGLALERAHGAGIVHRDLKPENVMLVKKGDDADFVKVLDFGVARFYPESQRGDASAQPLTRLGTILGTPEYMAPEQGAGDVVGPSADLYSVGVMLYEMLTGKHPFEADDTMAIMSMHMIAPVPAMSERAPDVRVEPAFEAIAKTLLEKEPKDRYPTARALVDALESAGLACGIELVPPTPSAFVESSAAGSPTPPPVDAFAKTSIGELTPAAVPPAKGLPRPLVIAAAAGALLLIAIAVLAFALRSSPPEQPASADGAAPASAATASKTTKSTTAGDEKIRAASALGPEGLEALAQEYPADPQVHRALALVLNDKGRVADALKAVRAMLALGKEGALAADAELADVVVGAAGLPATTDEAFALLEGPLGARGVDALIDMAQMKSSQALARRATRSLAKPEVRAKASPAAAVLLDMRAAKSCQAKRDVLERAKKDGDARMVAVLVAMKEPRGCGFMGMRDCWPCLRKDATLDEAIAGIQAGGTK